MQKRRSSGKLKGGGGHSARGREDPLPVHGREGAGGVARFPSRKPREFEAHSPNICVLFEAKPESFGGGKGWWGRSKMRLAEATAGWRRAPSGEHGITH